MSIHVTALYGALSGLWILILAVDVVRGRRQCAVGIGHGDQPFLARRIRVHGNAVEYIPMALLLLLFVELLEYGHGIVHGLGILLLVSRVLHAIGLRHSAGVTVPRFLGTAGTWLMMAACCGLVLAGIKI